jgi:arginine-tRNA-protein transferase
LAEGDRRWGRFLYRTACPECRACEPLRIDVERWRPRRTQRRTRRRCDAELHTEIGPPLVDGERLALFSSHKTARGLGGGGREHLMNANEYAAFLVERCAEALEFRFSRDGRLAGVAIADRGFDSLSAVYCYYDPRLARLGIGTYSILRQIEYCRREGLRWLYLGFFIAGHPHMAYKARFAPHERLVDGEWRCFDKAPG